MTNLQTTDQPQSYGEQIKNVACFNRSLTFEEIKHLQTGTKTFNQLLGLGGHERDSALCYAEIYDDDGNLIYKYERE